MAMRVFRDSLRLSILPILLAALLASPPILAQGANEPLQEERRAIVQVIRNQLAAFQRDDARAAFSFSSGEIQAIFGTSENFMRMVRIGYAPVYRPKSVLFLELVTLRGTLVQRVNFVGPNNRPWLAQYPMVRLADGRWRINGCFLWALQGGAT